MEEVPFVERPSLKQRSPVSIHITHNQERSGSDQVLHSLGDSCSLVDMLEWKAAGGNGA